LPPSWALKYAEFGRWGILLLIGVMYLSPKLLGYWLLPADKMSSAMLNTVFSLILPTAQRMLAL
ncbi:MAG TPA: hypothetical protein VHV78_04085, partial [Gemmatimonadaceae bacterium]|nr:hypothetical protein [Gemmatimonadaceae bacterium]